jgi:uncharacterized protein YcfJ
MNRSRLLVVSVLAAAVACSLPVQAETTYFDAQVLDATPIYRVIETPVPTRQCWEEEVVRSSSRHHYRSRTPGLLGAVIGGAIGNSVGHHNTSRKVGTVVGAILGGAIARDIQEADRYDHYDNVRLETVERCETVMAYEQGEKLVGYDVLYRYNGVDHTVRTPRDPGATIRVRVDVEPVI